LRAPSLFLQPATRAIIKGQFTLDRAEKAALFRLPRRHYPEVKIKLFYGSDYRKLLEKFAANGVWSEPVEEFTQI